MNNNTLDQIQYLLAQVSNYASKINEIIRQINNIINSQNQMNQMMQMNQMNQMDMMNNMINLESNFMPDLNPLLNNNLPQQLNGKMINVVFEYSGGKINVIASEYSPINEVINIFLKKIDKPELINNYKNEMKFLLYGKELDYSKNIKEIDPIHTTQFTIDVFNLKDCC